VYTAVIVCLFFSVK